jgi:hypothetical protein
MQKEEVGKEKSGAQVELKPHFFLRLKVFVVFRSNGDAHNNFFHCNDLHQRQQHFFSL